MAGGCRAARARTGGMGTVASIECSIQYSGGRDAPGLRYRPRGAPAASCLPCPSMPLRHLLPVLLALCVFGSVTPPARADTLTDARRLAAREPAQALALVDTALKARPRDAELRFLRGVLLTDLTRTDEARAVFEQLTLDYPELPEPLNNLAVLDAARGELDRARERLETALRLDPKHRAARENLGDIHLRLAIRHWEASAGTATPEPALARKLLLARQIAAAARP